jgi:biotin carboxyl carrier protein
VKYVVALNGRERTVFVEDLNDGRAKIVTDGVTVVADLRSAGGPSLWSLLADERSCEISVVEKDDLLRLTLRGATFEARVESEQERDARALGASNAAPKNAVVRASMPGFVAKVLVAPGDAIVKGQALIILEAMKMENEVRAEAPGIVAEIVAVAGKSVNGGDVLLKIQAP